MLGRIHVRDPSIVSYVARIPREPVKMKPKSVGKPLEPTQKASLELQSGHNMQQRGNRRNTWCCTRCKLSPGTKKVCDWLRHARCSGWERRSEYNAPPRLSPTLQASIVIRGQTNFSGPRLHADESAVVVPELWTIRLCRASEGEAACTSWWALAPPHVRHMDEVFLAFLSSSKYEKVL